MNIDDREFNTIITILRGVVSSLELLIHLLEKAELEE